MTPVLSLPSFTGNRNNIDICILISLTRPILRVTLPDPNQPASNGTGRVYPRVQTSRKRLYRGSLHCSHTHRLWTGAVCLSPRTLPPLYDLDADPSTLHFSQFTLNYTVPSFPANNSTGILTRIQGRLTPPLCVGEPSSPHIRHSEAHFTFHASIWRSKRNKFPTFKNVGDCSPNPPRIDASAHIHTAVRCTYDLLHFLFFS